MMEHKAHSLLGGSSAERWTKCPGSVAVQADDTTADKSSAFYGTLLHGLLEHAVRTGVLPCLGDFVPLPDWMAAHEQTFDWEAAPHDGKRGLVVDKPELRIVTSAFDCVEYWRKKFLGCIDEEHAEYRVKVGEDAFGTADFVLWANDYTDLVVLDLKTGQKEVAAENNPQLLYYATGCLRERIGFWRGDTRVHLHIVQPTTQADPLAAQWTTLASAVELWAATVLDPAMARAAQALAAPSPTPWMSAGPHCRYCPASQNCHVRLAYLDAVVDGRKPAADTGMANDKLAELLNKLYDLRDSFYAAKEEAVRRMLEGAELPGWRLRATSAPARWVDGAEEELALTFGASQVYERSLISPAELVRRFGVAGKRFVEQWADRPPGGYTVAPAARRAGGLAAADAVRRAKQIAVDGSGSMD